MSARPGSLFEASVNEFAKRANEKLAGKAKVVTFGSSQLGKDKELLQKLKLGHGELRPAVDGDVHGGRRVRPLRDALPGQETATTWAASRTEIFWAKIAPAAEAKGYKILAVWENGFRHITNNLRPINKPEDLEGIKLRTPKGAWRVKMFKSYGANPTPMSFSEVFVALQTGVIDGQENPFAQIYSAKFQEVQKYLSMTGHVYTPAYVDRRQALRTSCRPTCSRSSRRRPRRPRPSSTRPRPSWRRAARQAEGRRHRGQRGRQGRLRRGQQGRSTTSSPRSGVDRRRDMIDKAICPGRSSGIGSHGSLETPARPVG